MATARAYRRPWLLLPAVAASLTVQAAVFVVYEVTRPPVLPRLKIRFAGEGEGSVLVTRVGETALLLRCDTSSKKSCDVKLAPGTKVRLSVVEGDDTAFAGYHQVPMRTPPELVTILGDPLAACAGASSSDSIIDRVLAAEDFLECPITLVADTTVAVKFDVIPDEQIVTLLDSPSLDEVVKPLAITPPLTPIDAEQLDRPLEVAIAKPPPTPKVPPPLPPPPPPQEEQQQKPPPPVQPPPNMTMVEVKDQNVVKDAPKDATHLSDKNRDVAEETRAKDTNLEKEMEGKAVASRESDDTSSTEVGGPDDRIRQLEESEPTTDERVKETDHSGREETAQGAIIGERGKEGHEGTGPKDPGLLAMRGIEGRGAVQDQGNGRKAGKRGTPGINTPLSFTDYERIMGKERVDEERQVAARKMTSKKGRWERKLEAVKSSLENFIPDVRPGNQTALKTRAHPFALYIARMHRRIHELWGFGFLEDLDDKPADYALNNPDLWTNLEVSVNPDGTVHKVTIAKTSGKTEFDVAAVDTVLSAAPYEPTPEAIRSVNGKIYLRWGFYRNWRQCGTFNVEPYILTEVADEAEGALDDGAMVRNTAKLPGKKRPAVADKLVTPDDGKSKQPVSPTTSITDKQAVFAANLFVSAFATAQVDKLVKYSLVPFYAGGKVAAQTQGDLKDMFTGLVVESGPMKDWKLLAPHEYGSGSGELPEGNVVLQIRTAKESFAVVLTRTKSGDYRATQLAR